MILVEGNGKYGKTSDSDFKRLFLFCRRFGGDNAHLATLREKSTIYQGGL